MRILIVGISGYIGKALGNALKSDGHGVIGMTRSASALDELRRQGFEAALGDLREPLALSASILDVDPDVVVCTASAGGGLGDAKAFSADRDAVIALTRVLQGRDKTLVFTSGSAVFGTFAGGGKSDPAYPEDAKLPLTRAQFAPAHFETPLAFVEELEAAIKARVEAEQALLQANGLRGMIVRPGNIYGYGGSIDIPKHIEIARKNSVAPYAGPGETTHGYVHLDDVVSLYRLVIERGIHRGIYHAVAEEVCQKDLAHAISRMIGAGDTAQSVSLERMFELGGVRGLRLSVNKRLAADKTRRELGWSPTRFEALHDVEFGSYAR